MEQSNHEIMTRLLNDHPLPWTAVRDFDGANTGHSYILDANNEQVMRITTGIKTHRKVIDFLMYLIPDKMPEIRSPRTVPQMEAEIAAIQSEIGTAIGESMEEFGMTVPEAFNSPSKEH